MARLLSVLGKVQFIHFTSHRLLFPVEAESWELNSPSNCNSFRLFSILAARVSVTCWKEMSFVWMTLGSPKSTCCKEILPICLSLCGTEYKFKTLF